MGVIATGGLAAAAPAFGTDGRANAAHAGFDGGVAARLSVGKQSLIQHMESVMDGLRDGKRLSDALFKANRYWQPMAWPSGSALNMSYLGDGWSRLVNVFVAESEGETLFNELKEKWYWFKPL